MHRRRWIARSVSLVLAVAASTAALAPVAAAEPARAAKAEKYALSLLNCTRTGGWVLKSGKCIGRFSGKHSSSLPALKKSKGLSNKVALPWAKTLVIENECEHALPGYPGVSARFAAHGYNYWARGENIGCAWAYSAKAAVLATHRGMQAEKSYDGGHWRNMKAKDWKRVGIGVAHRNGIVMVVYDFYGKAVR